MLTTNRLAFANRLVRVVGRHATAAQVLNQVSQTQKIQTQSSALAIDYDYTQIDPSLSLNGDQPSAETTLPIGVGYAGLTPGQRAHFLHWLDDPTAPAPAAFQRLYLAHLEVTLLEDEPQTELVYPELKRLQRAPAWQSQAGLERTTLFGHWLAQDGPGLAAWMVEAQSPASLAGIALGCQALIGEPLHVEQSAHLLASWQLVETIPHLAVLALRLRSLTTNLAAEPLAYALAQLGPEAAEPRPWRAIHRDLRLALPQPDVRSTLTPLLAEMVTVNDSSTETERSIKQEADPTESASIADLGWHLILEFGQSRSEIFHFALTLAQRLPGFAQILDENRKLVYRVVLKKSELRTFWRLWEYVQSWSTTRVYLNGQELEKWKIFPYSQYLR